MRKSRAIMLRPLMLVLAVFLAVPSPHVASSESTFAKLFFIARSKNANEVHYDAQVRSDGTLDPERPVVSYWINKAEDGGRGPITFFQRRAYGHSAKRRADGVWTFTLTAFKERPMTVVNTATGWRVRTVIASRDVYLTSLFVATDESGWLPRVRYVDAFGQRLDTGAPVEERLLR